MLFHENALNLEMCLSKVELNWGQKKWTDDLQSFLSGNILGFLKNDATKPLLISS